LEGKEKINTCSFPLWFFHTLFAVFKISGATNFKEQRKQKAGTKTQGPIPEISHGSRQHLLILCPFVGNLKLSFRVVPVRGAHKRKMPRLMLDPKCV
jgi:hypothetical protein